MIQPWKIVRIITRLNIGGPAVHATLLSTQCDPARVSTCLVVGKPDRMEGDLTDRLQESQVRIVRLRTLRRPIRPWWDVVALLQLVRILWRERPHLVHTHMAKAGTLGRVAAFLYNTIGPGRRPGQRAMVIHTFHGHVLEGYFSQHVSWIFMMIERWLARSTDGLIAVSPTIRRELLQRGIGQPAQWHVIPLGLDLSALAQLPHPNGAVAVRCGIVGRLVPIKNPRLFLQAFDQAVREQPAVPLSGRVVGDGPLRQTLEREVHRLGLEMHIQFTGWQRDLRSVYEGLDVTCVTSWNEGTPVALIEAMAAGRTVVATDVGGVRDVLDDEGRSRTPIAPGTFQVTDRGILVRAGDAQGLAGALATAARDAALRRQLGRAARLYVLERFGADRLCRDIMALYDDVQARRAG